MDEVVRRYGFEPNRAGFICCPFHREKTPSLKVYSEPGRGFYCYGCGAGGSVIDFAMLLFKIPFANAVSRIDCDFLLGLLNDKPEPADDRYRYIRSAKEAKEKLDAAQTEYFQHLFGSAPVAVDSLARLERIYDTALTTWVSRDSRKEKYIFEHPTKGELDQREVDVFRAIYDQKCCQHRALWFALQCGYEHPLFKTACTLLPNLDLWFQENHWR